jgi:hypothetical protein
MCPSFARDLIGFPLSIRILERNNTQSDKLKFTHVIKITIRYEDSSPTQKKLPRYVHTAQAVVTVHTDKCKREVIPVTGRGDP